MTNISSIPNWENLSLSQQIAQLFIIRASGYLFDHEIKYPQWELNNSQLEHLIKDLSIGGIILLGGSAAEIKLRTENLQGLANIPLLVCADVEEGVGQRFSGATWFPPPMSLSSIYTKNPDLAKFYAEKMGGFTAKESLTIGINWILAPIVDVNNNPDNPVINIRAFGETSEVVSELTTAFIRGCQKYAVLTTAKHFPGHGDTNIDSHLDLPVLSHDLNRLKSVELPSFQTAIQAGVSAVMTAHLLIPSLDNNKPATLSYNILTKLLRQDLNFNGLIVTDALIMGAIAKTYGANEAPLLALEAGADLLLMPENAEDAIKTIYDGVKSGRISEQRIYASLNRIWSAKNHLFNNKNNQLSLFDLYCAESANTSIEIVQKSQKVFGQFPLDKPVNNQGLYRNLIITDDVFNSKFLGKHTASVTIPQKLGYELLISDRHTPPTNYQFPQPAKTLLQIFMRGNPFRGSAGLTPLAQTWFNYLLETNQLQAFIIYGSPYILEKFLPQLPDSIPCIFSYSQTPESQDLVCKVLFSLSD